MFQFRRIGQKIGADIITFDNDLFFEYKDRSFSLLEDERCVTVTDFIDGVTYVSMENLEQYIDEIQEHSWEDLAKHIRNVIKTCDERYYSPSLNRQDIREKVFTDVCHIITQLVENYNYQKLYELEYTIIGHKGSNHYIMKQLGLNHHVPSIYRRYFVWK